MLKRLKRPRMGVRESSVIRCPQFLQWLRGHTCAVGGVHQFSGRIEAAHVRTGTDGGTGLKPSDRYALPLCANHHHRQHQIGESPFEKETGISMRAIADALWTEWLKTAAGRKWRLQYSYEIE